jgi:multidrug efflux pump subunit AcrB
MRMRLTADDVGYVEASIRNVWQNLAIGAVFASLVMFLFLRSVRTTLVGIVGVPICTIAAFLGLLLAGRTINVISLAGVAFAIGMTLDNSIVVLESIELERRRGLDRFRAAVIGVKRVWPAVLASTLTTVLVFAPVLFVEQEAGQLYSDVAIAISASIFISMLVAISIVPTASSRLPDKALAAGAHPGFTSRAVVGAVAWMCAGWLRRLVVMGVVVVASAAIIYKLTPPAEYLPEGEEPKIFASMIPPPGYSLAEMTATAEDVQAYFLPFLDHEPEQFASGATRVPALRYINMLVQPERVRIITEPKDPAHANALKRVLTAKFREYSGMRAFAVRGSIISSNDGGTRSINLDISGPDLKAIYDTALAAYRRAEEVFDDPQIGSDPRTLSLSQPLLEIRPRWERAAELGLTAEDLGFTVAALTDGAYVDEFFLDDDKIDVYLYSTAGDLTDLSDIERLPIYTPQGTVVPVSAIADLVETVDTDSIRRVNGRRTVTLRIIPPRSVALETGVDIVRGQVVDTLRRAGEVPNGVSIDITGASDQLEATREALLGNYAVALLLCYLLLVAIFSNWGYPLLIMTTIPLGIAGGIVGLWLMNYVGAMLPDYGFEAIRQPFDMITMMGFLILMGTVVNNPILIVDQAVRNVREEGMRAVEAVRGAVATRLRPIAMSSITTFCGLSPLVFIPGAGTELYRGLGAVVLFGLMGAAVVTLTFLPALLVAVLRWGEGRADAPAAGPRPQPAPGD